VKLSCADENTTNEPSDTTFDPCLKDIDEYDSLEGECTPNEFTLDCGDDKIYCVVHEECVQPLIDQIALDGLTCQEIESSGEPVDTTNFAECVDATGVRMRGGEVSTCTQILERNPAACDGRLGEQCPVTCGFCEPEEDTTTGAPFECIDFRLAPSNDCPWLWQSLESDCNAVGVGERCEPEQSYPELGINDWDIDNCGIWRDVFVKLSCADENTTNEPSDTTFDPCLKDIDEYDSLEGECTPNEFTLDCGDDKIYCVVHEECVQPLIDQMALDELTCQEIESSGEPVDTTNFADCVDATEVSMRGGEVSTCAQIVERNPTACDGRLGEQCPVTCGFCVPEEDTTTSTIEPSEPEKDTTTEAPAESTSAESSDTPEKPVVKQEMTFEGLDTEQKLEESKESIKTALTTVTGHSKEKIELTFKGVQERRRRLRSGIVEAQYETESDELATQLSNSISNIPDDQMMSAINSQLETDGVVGVSVTSLSPPEVDSPSRSDTVNDETKDSSEDDDNNNLIMYVAIGGGIVVLLACAAAYMSFRTPKVLEVGDPMMEMQAQAKDDDKRGPELGVIHPSPIQMNYGGAVVNDFDDHQIEGTHMTGMSAGHTSIDVEGDAILTRHTLS